MDRRQKSETGETKPLSKNRLKRRGAEAIKKKFLNCFGVRTSNAGALRHIVEELIQQGVSRQTLVTWAFRAGYSRGYVSSLLSRILCSIGLRTRGVGAGRKPSPDAIELLAYVRSRYGERFLRVLHAAARAGRAQISAEEANGTTNIIVKAQLQRSEANCHSTISRETIVPKLKAACPPKVEFLPPGKIKLNHQRKELLR